jgi:DNA polymerase (family 10)
MQHTQALAIIVDLVYRDIYTHKGGLYDSSSYFPACRFNFRDLNLNFPRTFEPGCRYLLDCDWGHGSYWVNVVDKTEIANILTEIASFLEIKGDNPFKVRAYRNAARALLNLDESLETLIAENRLTQVESIGSHIAEKITTLFQKGKLPYYEKLKKSIPTGLLSLLEVPGLGPKKASILYKKLDIGSLHDLKQAAEKGKIAKIKGFGAKTEAKLLKTLQAHEVYQKRSLWWDAWNVAVPILEALKKIKGVKKGEICGSLRRKLETIGDLDFLIGSDSPKFVIDAFSKMGIEVLNKGETKCSIRLENGMQADLRVLPPKQFIYGLIYFTGSKEHNIKLRNRSLKRGYSLSEYGFEGKNPPKVRDEKEFYQALDLSYIPPELRENLKEIEAAEKKKIPELIEAKDIRGTLHNHTTASDGKNTLLEMVQAAEKLKWEYIGISDHSKSSFQANGLSEERLYEQIEQIAQMNRSKKFKIHILSGTECDILKDGSLDFSNDLLRKLDFVIASVHASFQLDEKTMTKRIIKALEHPEVTMLGHPTGRLLLKREPYLVNLRKVIDAAIANGKIIELNGNPFRLDMDWRLWHDAAQRGLKCCINADAHSIEQLTFFETGVNVARKGWLTPKDVINTLPFKGEKKCLQNILGLQG